MEFTEEFLAHQEEEAQAAECSMFLQRKLPSKQRDPGRFTVPCTIGRMKVNKALCDLGSSIKVIPLSLLSKLNIGEQKTAKTIELTLADNSIIKSQ
jgi:hypothetical protein